MTCLRRRRLPARWLNAALLAIVILGCGTSNTKRTYDPREVEAAATKATDPAAREAAEPAWPTCPEGCGSCDASARCLSWRWARAITTEALVQVNAVAATSAGRAVVVGRTDGATDYGDGAAHPHKRQEAFAAAYDGQGALEWLVATTGGAIAEARAVTVDGSGNVVVAGDFYGAVSLAGTPLTAAGRYNDVFVAKLDASGRLLWASTAGSENEDRGAAVAVDGAGNVFVAGTFWKSIRFGDIEATTNGKPGLFLAKLDSTGQEIWVRALDDTVVQSPHAGLAVDPAGNAVITTGISADSHLDWQVYVAKYSPQGAPLWQRTAGGPALDAGSAVACDAHGNILVAGQFRGSAMFGKTRVESVDHWDAFVAKYSPDGRLAWVRGAGGPEYDRAEAVAVDSAGDVYVAGILASTGSFGGRLVEVPEGEGSFLARYSARGTLRWVEGVGGPNREGGDSIYGVAIVGEDDLLAAGGFSVEAAFGKHLLSARGVRNAFLARFARTAD